MDKKNLFEPLPFDLEHEVFDDLLVRAVFRLERIVSRGQATAPGIWLDQDLAEWVILLKGQAGLAVQGNAEILVLNPGDYVYLPAHTQHRVEWTQAEDETVWLALHHAAD